MPPRIAIAAPPASILLVLAGSLHALAAPPNVTNLFPPGGCRGTTLQVTAAGSLPRWPVHAWVDSPGLALEAASTKGQFQARIAPDASPGIRLVRFHDDQGAGALRPFIIGTLPELAEVEPNDGAGKIQAIADLPVVINGRLARRGDVDAFRVSLKKGQTCVAAIEARRPLGSPLDGVLQVASPDGFVLEQADDDPGMDPILAFAAPADGAYLVRIFAFPTTPNSTIGFASGDDYIYRLTLTTGGFLEQALPLGVQAGGPREIEPAGWNIPGGLTHLRVIPLPGQERVIAWDSRLAGSATLPVLDRPSLVESGKSSGAREIPLPCSVSGRIAGEQEADRYRIKVRKGQAIRASVRAQAIGSPLDPVLTAIDDQGKVLVEQDDRSGADPEIDLSAPRDGTLDLVVRDLYSQGGSRHLYRLDVVTPRPDFELEPKEDRLTVAPGKPARLVVTVRRKDGFASPIAIDCLGLPAGVSSRTVTSEPKGPSAAEVTLTLEASPAARPAAGPLTIKGRFGPLGHAARMAVPDLPDITSEHPWLTVVPAGK